MEFRQSQLTRVASGVVQYINTHATDLPRTFASATFQELIQLSDGLRTDAGTQQGKIRDLSGEVTQRAALVEALFRDHLKPVVAAAKLQLRNVPNLESITLPNPAVGVARVVSGALGIANSVTPYAAQLIAAGLAPDFIAQLRAAAAAIDQSATVGTGHRLGRVNATGSLKQRELRANGVLRLLDRLVRSELATNKPALLEWTSARRVPANRGAVVVASAAPAVASSAPAVAATPDTEEVNSAT